MKNCFIFIIFFFISCNDQINYPGTKKIDVVDEYFGTKIIDPYRWMEDDMSKETESWVESQNELTFEYLEKIPFKNKLKVRLKQLWDYEKSSSPFKEGDFTYFFKNDGLQDQYVVYQKDKSDNTSIFIDPNNFSKDKTTSLAGISFSETGKICAYSISEGGSDWRKIIILDVYTKKILEDTLVDIKFSGISWKNDEGFFYSSYDKPEGSELSAKTDQHKLYYHKLNTSQENDILIYGEKKDEINRYVSSTVSDDGKYLFLSASKSTSGNKLLVKDLSNPNSSFKAIVDSYAYDTYVLDTDKNDFYLVTNINAPQKKIIKTNFTDLRISKWVDIIPNSKHVLSPSSGGGYIFANYLVNSNSEVY
tara:strand:- start:5913 stop:7001 length:1089 start_codon:yes stop_codon:yes gene_type:complete